jgi:hypothetical protein
MITKTETALPVGSSALLGGHTREAALLAAGFCQGLAMREDLPLDKNERRILQTAGETLAAILMGPAQPPNAPDQRPGATGSRHATEASSPGSLHLACSARPCPNQRRTVSWLHPHATLGHFRWKIAESRGAMPHFPPGNVAHLTASVEQNLVGHLGPKVIK